MKFTKNILASLAVILTLLMFFQACDKSSNADYTGKFTIKLNETINIPANQATVAISFTKVSDSRCPIDVNCVRAGEGLATLKLKTENNSQEFELCLGGCNELNKPTVQQVNINGVVYLFEMVELTPYPGTKPTVESTVATILVTKK